MSEKISQNPNKKIQTQSNLKEAVQLTAGTLTTVFAPWLVAKATLENINPELVEDPLTTWMFGYLEILALAAVGGFIMGVLDGDSDDNGIAFGPHQRYR